jgi:hypothetical protein
VKANALYEQDRPLRLRHGNRRVVGALTSPGLAQRVSNPNCYGEIVTDTPNYSGPIMATGEISPDTMSAGHHAGDRVRIDMLLIVNKRAERYSPDCCRYGENFYCSYTDGSGCFPRDIIRLLTCHPAPHTAGAYSGFWWEYDMVSNSPAVR